MAAACGEPFENLLVYPFAAGVRKGYRRKEGISIGEIVVFGFFIALFYFLNPQFLDRDLARVGKFFGYIRDGQNEHGTGHQLVHQGDIQWHAGTTKRSAEPLWRGAARAPAPLTFSGFITMVVVVVTMFLWTLSIVIVPVVRKVANNTTMFLCNPKKKNIAELTEEEFNRQHPPKAKPPTFSAGRKAKEEFNKEKALAEIAKQSPDKFKAYLISHLDHLNGTNIQETVKKIFNEFDSDGNDVLEGTEFEQCVQKFAEHMFRKYEDVIDALCKSKAENGMPNEDIEEFRSQHNKHFSVETFQEDVKVMIDKDGDGRITLEEAMTGFPQVVDFIEDDLSGIDRIWK